MDSTTFGSHEIKLPYIARTICEDAIILAEDLMGDATAEELDAVYISVIGQMMAVAKALSKKGLPNLDFDLFKLSTYSIEKIENGTALDPLRAISGETSNFIERLLTAPDAESNAHCAVVILGLIYLLQTIEENYLSSDNLDYIPAMASVDYLLGQLNQVCIFINRAPVEAENIGTKEKRKRRAKLGGIAKANRMNELKETVLLEASSHHATLPATQAATEIYKKLSTQGNWFTDNKGAAILTDPVARFTQWIRVDRASKDKK